MIESNVFATSEDVISDLEGKRDTKPMSSIDQYDWTQDATAKTHWKTHKEGGMDW